MPAIQFASALLARSSIAGIVLFLLPPLGQWPPHWQIGLAFCGWIAWCYRRGLLGHGSLAAAAVESVPSLWLSLLWTQFFVSTAAL